MLAQLVVLAIALAVAGFACGFVARGRAPNSGDDGVNSSGAAILFVTVTLSLPLYGAIFPPDELGVPPQLPPPVIVAVSALPAPAAKRYVDPDRG